MNTVFSTFEPAANPFALMIEPDAVLAAMHRSDRLNGLHSRVFRPLDKPLIPCIDGVAVDDLAAFDREIDRIED